jgi:hypothetical protein
VGNVEYIKKFKFNICPENFKCDLKGYITEKLLHSCLGGAIPVYFGGFDDIDEKIFNKNRIIFFDPKDEQNLDNTQSFIRDLINDKEKFKNFYRQPVFNENAKEVFSEMNNNVLMMINKLLFN